MKKHFFLFLTLSGLLSGCSKEIIDSGLSNDPVFTIAGTLNGNDYKITAGKDSVYHFTNVNFLPDRDMIEATGLFSDQTCPTGDCPGSVRFIFRSQISRTGLESQIANLPYLQDSISGDVMYPITITPIADTTLTTVALVLSNGTTSVGRMPLLTNLFSNAPITISVISEMGNGTYLSSNTTFLPQHPDSCQAIGIKATLESGILKMQINPALTSQFGYSYLWSNGYAGPDLEVDFSPGTLYTVSAIPANNACAASATLRLPNVEKLQINTPTFEAITTGATASIFQEGVEIQWTNAEGVQFSTSSINNNEDSYFIVEEIAPYKENENGDATLKLNIRYKCVLGSGNVTGTPANSVNLTGSGVIAVGQQ